jgi:ATP-binding cassette, subfamily B, bacterial
MPRPAVPGPVVSEPPVPDAVPSTPAAGERAAPARRRRRGARRRHELELPAELELPRWLVRHQKAAEAGLLPVLRRLPSLLRQVLGMAWRASPVATVLVAVLQLIAGAFSAFGLLATTSALQPLLAGGPTPQRVRAALPGMLLVAGAGAAGALVDAAVTAARARVRPKVRRLANDRLLAHTVAAELVAFDDPEFYNALEKARGRSPEGAIDQVIGVGSAVVGLVAVTGVLSVLHPVLLPLLAVSVLPQSWSTVRTARTRYLSRARRIMLSRWIGQLSWLLSRREQAPEVRAFTAQSFLLDEYRRVADLETAEEIRLERQQARLGLAGRALGAVGLGSTYAALGWLLYAGVMPLAVGATALLAVRSGRGALTQLFFSVNRLYEEGLYLVDYDDYLKQATARARRVTGRPAPAGFERIEVRGLTFSYPGSDQPALDGIDLTIGHGQVIALVGENGSGKTTLAKLLAGLFDPQEGSIRWDGTDLGSFDADSISERIAVVLQDPTQWPMSARANITIGRHDRHDPDQRALDAAARDARADEVIRSLPAGYDTLLSRLFKDGADLSGGQWQRMAVARGFYRDAPLLICDEPTANLDAKGEHRVYESIRQLARGRTIVLITHRLASTRTADRIYVLDRGRLIEQGTHEQLMAARGAYAELYDLQAAGYRDAAGPAA